MLKSIIRWVGLALVVIGIILVMKNLFNSNKEWNSGSDKKSSVKVKSYYNVSVSLKDEESQAFISGAKLSVKDSNGNVISNWTTENGVHLVSKLKKGTYIVVEQSAADGYVLNNDGVSFEIKNSDKEVVMYNRKMTEEEKKTLEREQREANTVASEVDVDNTLSIKGIATMFISLLSVVVGFGMIYLTKKGNA